MYKHKKVEKCTNQSPRKLHAHNMRDIHPTKETQQLQWLQEDQRNSTSVKFYRVFIGIYATVFSILSPGSLPTVHNTWWRWTSRRRYNMVTMVVKMTSQKLDNLWWQEQPIEIMHQME